MTLVLQVAITVLLSACEVPKKSPPGNSGRALMLLDWLAIRAVCTFFCGAATVLRAAMWPWRLA